MNPQVDTGYIVCYSRPRAYTKVYCSHALGAYSLYRSCIKSIVHCYHSRYNEPIKTKIKQLGVTKMKLRLIGSNQTELDLGFAQVFFSYETPVAARITDGSLIRTEQKYSVTTSKHINKWLDGCEHTLVPQQRIDWLLTSASECNPDFDEVTA